MQLLKDTRADSQKSEEPNSNLLTAIFPCFHFGEHPPKLTGSPVSRPEVKHRLGVQSGARTSVQGKPPALFPGQPFLFEKKDG